MLAGPHPRSLLLRAFALRSGRRRLRSRRQAAFLSSLLKPGALLSDNRTVMIWVFERAAERLRCEIRRESSGSGYELVVTNPDGSQRMERFDETAALIRRSLDLQRTLLEAGWRAPATK